jgi:acyl-coenzyme A thioesterase PaaI-like protein
VAGIYSPGGDPDRFPAGAREAPADASGGAPSDSWISCAFAPLMAGPVKGRLTLPRGRAVGPGELGMFADVGLGRAVLAHLGARGNIRTANLRLDLTGGCPSFSCLVLTAEAQGTCGYYLTSGEIRSVTGELVARCCGQFVVLPGVASQPGESFGPDTPRLEPYQELGPVVDLRVAPPGQSGWATFRTGRMIANRNGMVHGGVLLSVLQEALTDVTSALTGVQAPRLLSCTIEYYRGVPVDDQRVRLEAGVDHAGRRILAASGRLYAMDGRLLTAVRGTFATH